MEMPAVDDLPRREGRLPLKWEFAAVMVVMWVALVSIPLGLGVIGISWDALNHHIYLGWTAERARFDRDLLAASYQAFQYPYLYWPVYKLATSGFSGAAAGVVLASLHAVAVPAVWLIARSCIPGSTALDALLRSLAVVLAFLSILVLSLFDSTSNDLLAAIPLVWSIALGLIAMENPPSHRRLACIAASGVLAGVSVAFKLSNGPLAVLGPVLWVCAGPSWGPRLRAVLIGSVGAIAGFLLAYGYWAWQLWTQVGNPIYPFADEYFQPLRQWLGWKP